MNEEQFAELFNELQSRGDREKLMQLSSATRIGTLCVL